MDREAGARGHAQDRDGQQHPHALRRDRQRPPGAVLPWLAGELVLVAASAHGGERRPLPLRGPPHAPLWRPPGPPAHPPPHPPSPRAPPCPTVQRPCPDPRPHP